MQERSVPECVTEVDSFLQRITSYVRKICSFSASDVQSNISSFKHFICPYIDKNNFILVQIVR